MQVPVEISVDLNTKSFEVEVFSPPVSGLLKKAAGIEKGSGFQEKSKVGNLSIEEIISVAKAKMANLLCKDLKSAVKTVIGSCITLGILVENTDPAEVEKLIDEGKFDEEINKEKTAPSEEKKKKLKEFFDELKEAQEKKLKLETQAKEEAEAESAEAKAAAPAKTSEKTPEKAPPKAAAKAPTKK